VKTVGVICQETGPHSIQGGRTAAFASTADVKLQHMLLGDYSLNILKEVLSSMG
jgi:hypothetical protein